MRTVKFLQEHPAKKDEFEGAHEQIAESLADLVSSEKTAPCMIALEGGLGSGKSTVLKIFEDKAESSNFEVFVFDCFKYQNGPIRRAFIECFYLFIKNCISTFHGHKYKKRTKLDDLEDLKLKAIGRTEQIEGRDKFHLSPLTLIFAALLPLSAAALIVLGNIALGNSGEISKHWYAVLWVLVMAPVIQISLGYLGEKCSCLNMLSKILPDTSLRTGKHTSKTTILSTTEVTSIDLAKYYEEFLELLPGEKKIIIVLDNIDRLDAEKFFEIWADMEIFSRNSQGESHWVIIPYAPGQLQRAFDEQYKYSNEKHDPDGSKADGGKQLLLKLESGRENDSSPKLKTDSMMEEFINKWFTLRYRVPDILLSDWKEYFSRNWKNVFADVSEEECEHILLLFRHYRPNPQDITPRNIKHFINEVAACWSSSIEAVDRLVVVAYRLLIDHYQNDLLALFSHKEGYPAYAVELIDKIDDNYQKSMAALHYNVYRKWAYQIILYQPMKDAIEGISGEDLGKLLALKGGYDCLVELLEENPSFGFLENVCIRQFESEEKIEDRVLKLLNRKLNAIDHEAFQEPFKFIESVESVVDGDALPSLMQRFYGYFRGKLADADKESCEQLLISINCVIPLVERERKLEITPENLVDFWLPNRDRYENITISSFSQTKTTGKERFKQLISKWSEMGPDDKIPWSPSGILELGLSFLRGTISPVLDSFADLLGDSEQWLSRTWSKGAPVQALYMLVLLYDKKINYDLVFTHLVNQGKIESFSEDDKPLILIGLFALAIKANKVSELEEQFSQFDPDKDSDTIQKLLHTSCSYIGLVQAIGNIEDDSDRYLKLIAISIRDGWYNRRANTIFQSYPLYKSLVEKELLTMEDLWAWIMQDRDGIVKGFEEKDIFDISLSFLEDVTTLNSPILEKAKSFVAKIFVDNKYNSESWAEIIEFPKPAHKLALKHVERSSLKSDDLEEAIKNLVEKQLNENNAMDEIDFLFACREILQPALLSSLTDKIRKSILEGQTNENMHVIDRSVSYFDDPLQLVFPIRESEVQGFLNILRSVIEGPQTHPNLFECFVKNSKSIAKRVESASYIEKNTVVDVLKLAPEYEDSDELEDIKSIFDAFGVELKAGSSEEDDSKPPTNESNDDNGG